MTLAQDYLDNCAGSTNASLIPHSEASLHAERNHRYHDLLKSFRLSDIYFKNTRC